MCPGLRKRRSPWAQAGAAFLFCVEGGSGPCVLSPGAQEVQPRREDGKRTPREASAPGLG